MSFCYRKRVAFHDTDAMGVVHHANYIKYFEEARVAWLRELGMLAIHVPQGPFIFAVLDLECKFLKPAWFDDELAIHVECKIDKMRIYFRYAAWQVRLGAWAGTGTTTLVPLDRDLQVTRLPSDARAVFASMPWSETWPPPAGGPYPLSKSPPTYGSKKPQ